VRYKHPLAASAVRTVEGYRTSQPENQQVSKPTRQPRSGQH